MTTMLSRLLRTAARNYPLYSGCGLLANSPLFTRTIENEQGLHWAELRSGPRILVPIEDFVGRSLYFFGDLDPKLSWVCNRLLRRGDTVLDIGANLGLVSLTVRVLVGAEGAVHAFEPQPDLADLIVRSARANGFDDIDVHRLALGETDSTLELFVPDHNRGAASLTRRSQRSGKCFEVPVRNTSQYLETLDLGPIRLVKMDVEGHEEHVIRGGQRFFEQNRPDVIVFELNDRRVPFHEQPIVGAMRALDYELYALPKAIARVRIRRIESSTSDFGHDIVAIARGRKYREVTRRFGV